MNKRLLICLPLILFLFIYPYIAVLIYRSLICPSLIDLTTRGSLLMTCSRKCLPCMVLLPLVILFIRHVITSTLWSILRRSLNEDIFLDIWKITHITPVFKSGINFDVKNYRSISILPPYLKLLNHWFWIALYPS